ncbi:hypothetical protein P0C22_05225 [Plesiomonas shigelloides]|uniref:hypothetical protein n=1 Tax=Plesiomonas shigelloides TaxID=703 RepID=UPI0030C1B6CA
MNFNNELIKALQDIEVREQLLLTINELMNTHHLNAVSDSDIKDDITENVAIPHKKDNAFQEHIEQLQTENMKLNDIINKIKNTLGIKCLDNTNIEHELLEVRDNIYLSNKEASNLKEIIETLKKETTHLEGENHKQNTKIAFYQNNFSTELRVFECYNKLSGLTKQSLDGIFKDTSIQGLMACGIQEKNISNLWDYTKNEIVNNSNQDIVHIINLFELLFERFILAYPMFTLQIVSVGDTFDTHSHIKHNSSINTSGLIKDVVLRGYINTKTDKVIKASVVII